MRKIVESKKNIAGLLIVASIAVILLMLFVFSYKKNSMLDAKEQNKDKIMVKVNNIPVTEEIVEIDGNQAEVELSTKKNKWIKIPLEKGFSLSQVLENGQESSLPVLSSDDFNIDDEMKKLKNYEKVEDGTDLSASETDTISSTDILSSTVFQTAEKKKEFVYVLLVVDQPVKLKINRENASESIVKVIYLDAQNSSKTILKLNSDKHFFKPAELLTDEGITNDKTEEFNANKISDEVVSDSIDGNSRAISVSDPFKVSVDIDRLTGIAPFDTNDDPGYDSSPNNDRVRTFDSVNYTLRAGISLNNSSYKSFRVRVDTKVAGAWRLDSSGQLRQTAELLNGSLTNGTNGTKNSTHSTWVNIEGTSGQVFVTETLNTYGGVNNDEINPEFVLTIESVVNNSGETISINQVIDKSVSPNMSDKVYLSAKPYVDVKLTINTTKATFDKASGTNDKPNHMVAGTAAYVQLKPLPDRADITSMKGVTYPVGGVKYKIKQKIYYKENQTAGTKELEIGRDTQPVEVIAYDKLTSYAMPNPIFTSQFQSYAGNYTPVDRQGTAAPGGYTNNVYSTLWTQRPSYYNWVGIYNTGNPVVTNNSSNYEIEVENKDYSPIDVGPNKYLVNGVKMGANDKPFSVVAMQTLFPYQYLEDRVGVNSSLEYYFSVDEISYEDQKQTINSTLNYSWARKWPGTFETYAVFVDKSNVGLSTADIGTKNWGSTGDGSITQGDDTLKVRFWANITNPLADKTVFYGRWNADSFSYDSSRSFSSTAGSTVYFGVSKANNNFPDVSLRDQSDIENSFNWFDNPTQAMKTGDISAVKCESAITSPDGKASPGVYVPLKNISSIGGTDSDGNPNIAVTNAYLLKKDDTLIDLFPKTTHKDYEETKYNGDGELVSNHSPSTSWGDTLYIRGILVRPNISANKSNYNPTEKIVWTAKGTVTSGSDQNHEVQLDVTIPKETLYEYGSATNHKGETIPNPTITENSDGTKTLRFIQDYLVAGKYDSTVNFKTSIVSSSLNFINNQATLSAKVVAQVWLESDPDVIDTSLLAQRTSNTLVTVSNAGVIVIDKVTDKPFIESGNEIDLAKPETANPTDIKFTISYKNHSTGSLGNVRALDVLPYNGDGRGTQYSGSYSVVDATMLAGNGELWYTDKSVSVQMDPNSVDLSASEWKKLGSDQSVLSNAKATMAVYSALSPGETFSYSVTLRPKDQKAGDYYANSPTLNSNLNQLVNGVVSVSSVLGRELSGIAWYDDDLDGILGNSEEKVANVPVKLYRTSQINDAYKQELVTESLTGELFIDKSNNSLVNTNEQGEYVFKNLPEGEYIIEFAILDKLQQKKVLVTKKLAGNDSSINSKANTDIAKTDEYIQPTLSELPDLVDNQSLYKLPYVNIGLIRPSKVSLFKYVAGTAVDMDGNGELSDEEKAKGTPLKNAEFDLYDADSDQKVGTAKTDATGVVMFDGLFPGKYNLIETKSPEGYELVKKKISFEVTKGNQTIKLYQDDSVSTKLPFTGSDKTFVFLVITSSSLILFGLMVVIFKSRSLKRRQL